jgi:putative protein kinase ArgK-like GTPase of G3E family
MADVKAALSFEQRPWSRPVLAVSAATNLNLDKLEAAIVSHYDHLCATKTLASTRAEQVIAWAVAEVVHEIGVRGLTVLGGSAGVRAFWSRQPTPWSERHRLMALLEAVDYKVKSEQ